MLMTHTIHDDDATASVRSPRDTAPPIIDVEGVVVEFGALTALAGVDLTVRPGEVRGLLGPNGSGKTTLVSVIATLRRPSAGTVRIAGHDVGTDPVAVRRVIGLAGQYAAVDDLLTGRENLEIVGRLYGLPARDARRRASDVLERLSLTGAADRLVRTYSGGMRRRLDLGASLAGRPRILLLDEPTTGLDPRTRLELWDFLRELVAEGTTVLLTTQYLDEADALADRITVIDGGRVIAEGTADQLKSGVTADLLVIRTVHRAHLPAAAAVLETITGRPTRTDEHAGTVSVAADDRVGDLLDAADALRAAGVELNEIGVQQPGLDDVFLSITGTADDRATDSNGSSS